VEIDGSYGEGGGQILRTALALAAITGQAMHISPIRPNRPRAGLRPQHLTGARAVCEITGGELSGDVIGSTELAFRPGTPRPGSYTFDVAEETQSAGSVPLLAQTLLPVAAAAGGEWEFVLRGGTHVPFSPTFEYLDQVFLPAVCQMGVDAGACLARAGFYPRGGGEMRLVSRGWPFRRPIARTGPQEIERVTLQCLLSELDDAIAQRCLSTATSGLPRHLVRAATRQVVSVPAEGPGVVVWVRLDGPCGAAGFSALGERRKRAEVVGREAALSVGEYVIAGQPVDARLADQLLLYMALTDAPSTIAVERVSLHTTTSIHVIEAFLGPLFSIDDHRISRRG